MAEGAGGKGRPSDRTRLSAALTGIGGLLGELGLNMNECRVLLCLLQRGPSRPGDLARQCEIGRTNIYPLLEILQSKGLADQLPGPSGHWTAIARDEVIDRLYATQEERFRALRHAADRARAELVKLVPADISPGTSCTQRIDAPSQVKVVVNQLLGRAELEVLIFDCPPYAWSPGTPNPAGLEAMDRGVQFRELCLTSQLSDPEAEASRNERDAYIQRGMQVRVVDDLPMKLIVADRRVSLVVLLPAESTDGSYPDVLMIDHRGCAEVYAESFEARWGAAKPYPGTATAPMDPGAVVARGSSLTPSGADS